MNIFQGISSFKIYILGSTKAQKREKSGYKCLLIVAKIST